MLRMGAALRHAARTLGKQSADKKLLLELTDGQPADIDVKHECLLIENARQSVRGLDHLGPFTCCFNLDAVAVAFSISNSFVFRHLGADIANAMQGEITTTWMI